MLRIVTLGLALGALGIAARAQSDTGPDISPRPSNLPIPVTTSRWEHTETVRTSFGWRDNAVLSPFAPIARSFGRGELEAFALWSQSDWEFVSFLNGDVLRYFSPPAATTGEEQWFGHAELRWRYWPSW